MHNKRFSLDEFIATAITGRGESLFAPDIRTNHDRLAARIDDKSVLVIGGAGTIGSSFTKALLRFRPSRIVVVDINENGLTELTRDLRSSVDVEVPRDYRTYPIDFGGKVFQKLLEQSDPFDIVANFAAHKHVRSEKDHYSIEAMIGNNVFNTWRLLEMLSSRPPEHFFCVSTDKAANPVNVMGASKKLMEEVILSYADVFPVTTARFANVAFSNGSLLYGFIERMMKSQPLSAPSDVRRYFVSPQESGQLCLLACVLGAPGDIFFPKLDPSDMKTFSEIAVSFLSAYGGYDAEQCASESEARQKAVRLQGTSSTYPVYFFESDTSGEKPYEEFFTGEEQIDLDRFHSLGVISSGALPERSRVASTLGRLRKVFESDDVSKSDVVGLLKEILPGFDHLDRGKNLDERM